jgi:hypothetical protein
MVPVGFVSGVLNGVFPEQVERLWCRIGGRPTPAEELERLLDRVIEKEAEQSKREADLDRIETSFEGEVAGALDRHSHPRTR